MDRLEWHRYRMAGIGSSDAPVLHGMSKYRKYHELMIEKVSQVIKDSPSNYIQALGNELEPKMRGFFSLDWMLNTGMSDPFEPKLLIHPKKDYLRASMDGLSQDGLTFIECKLVGAKILASGVVPIAYYMQMQHQYLVSNAESGYCVMCDMKGRGMRIIPVSRDDSFIDVHKRSCKDFWAGVLAGRSELLTPNQLANPIGLG